MCHSCADFGRLQNTFVKQNGSKWITTKSKVIKVTAAYGRLYFLRLDFCCTGGDDEEKDGWGELWRMHLDCKRMRHQPQAGKASKVAAVQEKVAAAALHNSPAVTPMGPPQAKNWLQLLETYLTKICAN